MRRTGIARPSAFFGSPGREKNHADPSPPPRGLGGQAVVRAMSTPLRIAMADDHALFRDGLKSLLSLHEAATVVAEIDRADDILPLLNQNKCDLLLLDLQMDRNTLVDIAGAAARVPVMVVTASERLSDVFAAIHA